jgi:hypothetical protein
MTQMRRGAVEYCVMALLRDRDRYGLELARALVEADGLVSSEGTIYPLLSRLRNERPGGNLLAGIRARPAASVLLAHGTGPGVAEALRRTLGAVP